MTTALPGFGLRLREGGKRTWIVQYRVGAKQRRVTLGTVETLNADEARKRARSALSKVHLGHDPQLEKGESARASGRNPRVHRGAVPRRTRGKAPQAKNLGGSDALSAQALEAFTRRPPLTKFVRVAVAGQLGRIAKERGPIAANQKPGLSFDALCVDDREGLADANPVVGTNKAAEEMSRDRVLSDEELRLVWAYAGEGDYGVIIRLLF